MQAATTERQARLAAGLVVAACTATLITVGIGTAAAAPPDQPDTQGAIKVELGATKRDCDFNPVNGPGISTTAATAPTWHSGGGGFALISSAEGSVNAEIHLINAAPSITYTVWLMELPNVTCSPGAAGVAVATVQTDPAGNGTVNLQTDVVPGATGAWVTILDGSGQVYTSNTVAPVGASG